jgi:metabotropic X receptor
LDPNDETRCLLCPNGTLPDQFNLVCVALPEKYLRPDSLWAIGAMTFALIGIVLATGVLVVFVRYVQIKSLALLPCFIDVDENRQ